MPDHKDHAEITPENVQDALYELEGQGLVKRTGAYRNGAPVYVCTEYGACVTPEVPIPTNTDDPSDHLTRRYAMTPTLPAMHITAETPLYTVTVVATKFPHCGREWSDVPLRLIRQTEASRTYEWDALIDAAHRYPEDWPLDECAQTLFLRKEAFTELETEILVEWRRPICRSCASTSTVS